MPFTYSKGDVIPHLVWRDCLTTTTNLSEERRTSRFHRLGPMADKKIDMTPAVRTTHITILSLTSPKKDKKQLQAFHWLPSRWGSIGSCKRHTEVCTAAVSVKKEKTGIETLNTPMYLTEIQSNEKLSCNPDFKLGFLLVFCRFAVQKVIYTIVKWKV